MLGGDAVMGARTVVEAVAIAKQVAESMDKYMKSLPADTTPDPYADIPTFQTPHLRRSGQTGSQIMLFPPGWSVPPGVLFLIGFHLISNL